MSDYEARRGPRTGAIVWSVRTDPGTTTILPDGFMDVVWTGDTFLLAGADTAASTHTSVVEGVVRGLRLAPGVAQSLLRVAASELTDERVDLSRLVSVPDRIVDLAHIDPTDALERLVAELWRRASPEPSALRLAASLDRAARAGDAAPTMASRHGFSERHLRRTCDRIFGYGPKTLSSIHRFQHALHLARAGAPLAEASARAGYADQSHLSRETRRLAGTTPRRLIPEADPF